jgi:hypothetical protein
VATGWLHDLPLPTDISPDPEASVFQAPTIRVIEGNDGAGGSCIALAIADASATSGRRTRLVDPAPPSWSNHGTTADIELSPSGGWRRGQRGQTTTVHRLRYDVTNLDQVPKPSPDDDCDLVVLDAAWTARELFAAHQSWVISFPADLNVVVATGNPHALTRSELTLAALPKDRTVLVVLGASIRRIRQCLPVLGPDVGLLWERQAVLSVNGPTRPWAQPGEPYGHARWQRAIAALVLDRIPSTERPADRQSEQSPEMSATHRRPSNTHR